MARRSKPWFRKARRACFATINGEQHNLGPDKAEAYERFYQLMRQPPQRKISPNPWRQSPTSFWTGFKSSDRRKRTTGIATGWSDLCESTRN